MTRSTPRSASSPHDFTRFTPRRSGMGLTAIVSMVAAGGLATAGLVVSANTMWTETTPGVKDAIEAKEAKAKKVESTSAHQALVIAGLTPANLAAAGLDAGDATALIASAQGYLVGGGIQMAMAMSDQSEAAGRVAGLEDRVVSGRAREGDVAQLATARADLAAAATARETAVSNFYAAVTVSLTLEQREALANIRAQQPSTIPPAYLVRPWEEADQVALRDAIAARRIAERKGDLGFVAPDVLSNAEAVGDIANSLSHVENNLAAIRVVWDGAFGG